MVLPWPSNGPPTARASLPNPYAATAFVVVVVVVVGLLTTPLPNPLAAAAFVVNSFAAAAA